MNNERLHIYESRAGWYSLKYPSSWVIDEEEECLTICNPRKGVGALQISAYHTPGYQEPGEVLLEYLTDNEIRFDQKKVILDKSNRWGIASYDYVEDQWYKKVWFISKDSYLLLITYNCRVEQQGIEIGEAESIVRSVSITSEH